MHDKIDALHGMMKRIEERLDILEPGSPSIRTHTTPRRQLDCISTYAESVFNSKNVDVNSDSQTLPRGHFNRSAFTNPLLARVNIGKSKGMRLFARDRQTRSSSPGSGSTLPSDSESLERNRKWLGRKALYLFGRRKARRSEDNTDDSGVASVTDPGETRSDSDERDGSEIYSDDEADEEWARTRKRSIVSRLVGRFKRRSPPSQQSSASSLAVRSCNSSRSELSFRTESRSSSEALPRRSGRLGRLMRGRPLDSRRRVRQRRCSGSRSTLSSHASRE
ncbi:hypothetical protein F4780DRAFT_747679 [Xylariomycetidae sp. FL0641]|nr:hypothetical protein F4780DRAFT_747679 [Xylariomycetidae sp. FL0641]